MPIAVIACVFACSLVCLFTLFAMADPAEEGTGGRLSALLLGLGLLPAVQAFSAADPAAAAFGSTSIFVQNNKGGIGPPVRSQMELDNRLTMLASVKNAAAGVAAARSKAAKAVTASEANQANRELVQAQAAQNRAIFRQNECFMAYAENTIMCDDDGFARVVSAEDLSRSLLLRAGLDWHTHQLRQSPIVELSAVRASQVDGRADGFSVVYDENCVERYRPMMQAGDGALVADAINPNDVRLFLVHDRATGTLTATAPDDLVRTKEHCDVNAIPWGVQRHRDCEMYSVSSALSIARAAAGTTVVVAAGLTTAATIARGTSLSELAIVSAATAAASSFVHAAATNMLIVPGMQLPTDVSLVRALADLRIARATQFEKDEEQMRSIIAADGIGSSDSTQVSIVRWTGSVPTVDEASKQIMQDLISQDSFNEMSLSIDGWVSTVQQWLGYLFHRYTLYLVSSLAVYRSLSWLGRKLLDSAPGHYVADKMRALLSELSRRSVPVEAAIRKMWRVAKQLHAHMQTRYPQRLELCAARKQPGRSAATALLLLLL